MIQKYFYDTECKRIESDDGSCHDKLAEEIINKDPILLKEYKEIREKGVVTESVFLVMKGYIYVGGPSYDKMSTMYSSISLNSNTKAVMAELKEDGYYAYDIIQNELTENQKDKIRSWAKSGIDRDEKRKKVMIEMIAPLAPTKEKEVEDEER